MAEEASADDPGDGPGTRPGDGEWFTIAAAARRLGVSPRAIRGRIARGTIEWRRAGNTGKLVLLRPEDVAADHPEDEPGDDVDQLREELREAIERAHAAEVKAATLAVELDGAQRIAQAQLEAMREQLTAEVAARNTVIRELRALLAEARRPWWRRLLG